MFAIGSKFAFDAADTINSGENNGLESWRLVPVEICGTQLSKEVEEYLIVCGAVYFIDDKDERIDGTSR